MLINIKYIKVDKLACIFYYTNKTPIIGNKPLADLIDITSCI